MTRPTTLTAAKAINILRMSLLQGSRTVECAGRCDVPRWSRMGSRGAATVLNPMAACPESQEAGSPRSVAVIALFRGSRPAAGKDRPPIIRDLRFGNASAQLTIKGNEAGKRKQRGAKLVPNA